MSRPLDKVTMLALAALLDLADNACAEPRPPTIQLRSLLALLYSRSNRDREPYANFWQTMTEEGSEPRPGDHRGSYGVTHWLAIVRTLGGNPDPIAFHERVRSIISEHGRDQSPAAKTRRLMPHAVGQTAVTREIFATKGRPHSQEAWTLTAERAAAGLAPDGAPLTGSEP